MANDSSNKENVKLEKRKLIISNWFEKHLNTDELFACAICHHSVDVDHPIHCPECSKLFCGYCIDRWFRNRPRECLPARCPCCQAETDADLFISCRVYQDVHEAINGLRDNLDELLTIICKPLDICEEHDKELVLFCEKCTRCICFKCLLDPLHKDHIDEVMELDDAREKYQAEIESEKKFLEDRLVNLNLAGEQITANECDIVDAGDAIIEDINWATERIIDRIRGDVKERFKQHVEPLKAVTKQQTDEVANIIRKSYELASEQNSEETMMATYHMADSIRKMHNDVVPDLQLPEIKFINPITPPFVELYFTIRGFARKLFIFGSAISEEKSAEEFTIRLKGQNDKDENGNGIIRLSLQVIEGYEVHDVKVICYPSKGTNAEPLARFLDLNLNEDNTMLEFPDTNSMEGFLNPITEELNLRAKLRLWATYYDKCAHKDWQIAKHRGVKQ